MNTRFAFTYAYKLDKRRMDGAFASKTFKENMNKIWTNLKICMK